MASNGGGASRLHSVRLVAAVSRTRGIGSLGDPARLCFLPAQYTLATIRH